MNSEMIMGGSGSQQSLQYQKRMQGHSPSNVQLDGVTGVGGIPMPGGYFHTRNQS